MQTMGPSYQARMKARQGKPKKPSTLKEPKGETKPKSTPSMNRGSDPAPIGPPPKRPGYGDTSKALQKSGLASYGVGVPKKEEPKKQTFKQAFAAARKAGKATFMWDGRKFTTQTKEEKRAADNKRVRDANRAVLTNKDGTFKRGNSIPTSFGPQAKPKR